MTQKSDNNDISLTSSRRSLLKSVPMVGASLALGDLATGQAVAAENGNGVHLGEFSDGLDGWTTTGSNDLVRVDEEEMPRAVQVGTHALAVEINGDLQPMIENQKQVKDANFIEHL